MREGPHYKLGITCGMPYHFSFLIDSPFSQPLSDIFLLQGQLSNLLCFYASVFLFLLEAILVLVLVLVLAVDDEGHISESKHL